MNESTTNNYDDFNIANISTYRSGVIQSHAFRNVKQYLSESLKPYNLSPNQWFMIGLVNDAPDPGATITELANQLGTTLAYTTNMVNLLESRGIVEKNAHSEDARTKLITLAPDYTQTIEDIELNLRDALRDYLYNDISREELTVYIKVLFKLSQL